MNQLMITSSTKKADRLIDFFLAIFFTIGLLLAFYYNTWIVAAGTGSLCIGAYYCSKFILKESKLYQYILSAVLGIFTTLFIYQVHGMFQMNFFAFIASAILITYRNWKLQIPLAVVVIVQYAVTGYLGYKGITKTHFVHGETEALQIYLLHALMMVSIFFLCGLWAYNFKKLEEQQQQQNDAIYNLKQQHLQKESQVAMTQHLKVTNMQLKNANDELQKIFNTIEEVLFSIDMISHRFIQISRGCLKVYGYVPDDFMQDNNLWAKVIHPDDKYIIYDNTEKLQNGHIVINKYRIIHKNGKHRWIEAKMIPTIKNGQLIRIDGICNDITKRVKLENKLAEEKSKRHQQITAAVITAQENERTFLGEELHDNINPILATAKLYMECAAINEEKRLEMIKDGCGFITTAMNEIRLLSKSLIPPSLGEISLANCITDMIVRIKKVQHVTFVTQFKTLNERRLSDILKLTAYRIIQEQLNNIFKHANATTITISLHQTEDKLELMIKDDGMGFNLEEKRNGVGLQNIISRTEILNGKVIIKTAPGNGCELMVNFDIHKSPPQVMQIIKRA